MKKSVLIFSFLFILAGVIAIPSRCAAQTDGQAGAAPAGETPADQGAAQPAQDLPAGDDGASDQADNGGDEETPESAGDDDAGAGTADADDDGSTDPDPDSEVDEDCDPDETEGGEIPADDGTAPAGGEGEGA